MNKFLWWLYEQSEVELDSTVNSRRNDFNEFEEYDFQSDWYFKNHPIWPQLTPKNDLERLKMTRLSSSNLRFDQTFSTMNDVSEESSNVSGSEYEIALE